MSLSPSPIQVLEPLPKVNFFEAVKACVAGKRITKNEWGDNRHYCLMKDGFLYLHKAGESSETLHFWIINDGDINGEDYVILGD